MGRIVLDTSAYSRLRIGHPEVMDLVAAAEVVIVPTIALGELEAGFELGTRERENRALLREFLAEPFVAVRAVTRAVASHYGAIFAYLRKGGTPIPLNDVWIAATARESGGRLVTFDEHFGRVPGLDLVLLQAE